VTKRAQPATWKASKLGGPRERFLEGASGLAKSKSEIANATFLKSKPRNICGRRRQEGRAWS